MRIALTKQEAKEREAKVIEMYKAGISQREICDELRISTREIQRITKEAGIYVRFRSGEARKRIIAEGKPEEKNCTYEPILKPRHKKITPDDINKVRHSIKIGDHLRIRTSKGIALESESEYVIRGVIRDAIVISTANPTFCLVRLAKSGVIDSVRWSDIYVARRDKKKVIG